MSKKTVGIIGVGKLGQPCAEKMAECGHTVKGYDVVGFNSELITQVSSIMEVVRNSDIVFIAVPTPHSDEYGGETPSSDLLAKDFDYSIVISSVLEANKYMNSRQMLVLISTVLPGTTRRDIAPLISNTQFVYNPYLIAMGSVAWDMVNPEMVMIGTEDGAETGAAKELIEFYKPMMQNDPRYVVGTWDECEAIKVFYNTFISAKIGLVNMIQDVAERQGNINVDIVTDALAKSEMRIMGPQYMTAGMGDSGACHPRDNIALRSLSQRLNLGYDLFGEIMHAREIQANNIAIRLVELAEEFDLPIFIHGKAYKPRVEYLNGSYSLLVGHYVEEAGHEVTYVDPLTEASTPSSIKGVILLAHSPSTTYKYMHSSGNVADINYCEFEQGSVILDPWRNYKSDDEDLTVIHYGNTRR